MSKTSSITLPAVEGWPYEQILSAFGEFQQLLQGVHGKPQPSLMVGGALWSRLREISDAEGFFVCGIIPVHLDLTGILEPHEFMFALKW